MHVHFVHCEIFDVKHWNITHIQKPKKGILLNMLKRPAPTQKEDQKLVFKIDYCSMQVKSIAAILSIFIKLRSLACLFLSCRLTGFTVYVSIYKQSTQHFISFVENVFWVFNITLSKVNTLPRFILSECSNAAEGDTCVQYQ